MNVEAETRITLKNMLVVTDLSQSSLTALPFALAFAREHGATVHALHVLAPAANPDTTSQFATGLLEAHGASAGAEMQRIAAQLAGLPHALMNDRGIEVWTALERILSNHGVDLIIMATHGRADGQKLLLGPLAEEIFQRSKVAVLTIGPGVRCDTYNGGRFHCVLFATDFTPESVAAARYAVSLAQENQARLILLHVIQMPGRRKQQVFAEPSVAEVMYKLSELVPRSAELWCRLETVVDYGDPGEKILEGATRREADLIVLGVRDAANHLGGAAHPEWVTARQVVAHATCPVLTVRG